MLTGCRLESVALTADEKKVGAQIMKGEDIGLLAQLTCQFFGGSLDGILPDGTPINVKTVHILRENKAIIDAARR